MHCFQCWKENFRHWTCKLLVQLTTPIVSLFKFLFTCSGAKPKKEANPVFVRSSWGNCKRVYLQDMSECYCCKKLEVCKHSMNGDTVYRLFWCSWDQMSAIILSRRWSCLSIILYNVFHIDANALLWKDSTIANAYRYKEFWRTFVLSQFLTGVCTFYSTYINPHPFSETFKSIYDDKRLIHCCHQAHLHNHLQ